VVLLAVVVVLVLVVVVALWALHIFFATVELRLRLLPLLLKRSSDTARSRDLAISAPQGEFPEAREDMAYCYDRKTGRVIIHGGW